MTRTTVTKIVVLGAVTGMRSMSGVAALASSTRSLARPVMALAAASEMVADKSPRIGNRIDPLPLGGRVVLGAFVGAVVARERRENALLGSLLGAATAWAATHLAYEARRRLPLDGTVAGLLEDGIVVAMASRYA